MAEQSECNADFDMSNLNYPVLAKGRGGWFSDHYVGSVASEGMKGRAGHPESFADSGRGTVRGGTTDSTPARHFSPPYWYGGAVRRTDW